MKQPPRETVNAGARPPAGEAGDDHTRLDDPVEVAETQAEAPAAAPKGWAPPRSGLRMTLVFVAFVLAGALVVLYAWGLPPFRFHVQSTDNAYVRGQTTVISPQVNGYVTEVLVQDFQEVRQGQPIVRIDARIYRQRVEQARAAIAVQQATLANSAQSQRSAAAGLQGQGAAVASARAQLERAQADMRRVEELVADRSVSLRERDQTLAALRQAEAALQQAQAQRSVAQEQLRTVTVGRAGLEAAVQSAQAALRLAEIDLANTEIVAPRDGRVSEVGVRIGQYVTAGSQLLFLVPPTVWIVANFKEAQTARMRPGQPAWVTVDALGGARLEGRIERIAPATGNEFAVIKPDNATGNFVKVPQRLSVRITLDPGQPLLSRLRPGMSVQAHVDTAVAEAADPGTTP
ncbi:HlyD family secretion protein [uncultured Azohydromonas sp.]|uniref:HlyD family secretion protein n=1 Tax=uncultured Azohydromonas sp. TaxID=487342 RepID=UPI002604C88A|nr:HlyD family secretion protein [uncultured Azohydromonas sp.]